MVFGCYRCESIEKDGYFHFGWSGQYPSVQIPSSDDLQGEDEVDIPGVIEMHILPGDICQIGVSGNQKLCDIGGPLIWVPRKEPFLSIFILILGPLLVKITCS